VSGAPYRRRRSSFGTLEVPQHNIDPQGPRWAGSVLVLCREPKECNLASEENNQSLTAGVSAAAFPSESPSLETFGLKFSAGGAHISRTMMVQELAAVLDHVPLGSSVADYRAAVLDRNVRSKTTESTRLKSLRHLRELYALDEATPIFALLRKLHRLDSASLPLLALQVAWARYPLLRATTVPILEAGEGEQVETADLAQALETAFPKQYSELNRNKIARNASSSWTQSGHLSGRSRKIRHYVKPAAVVATMALEPEPAGHCRRVGTRSGWKRRCSAIANRGRATLKKP